MHFLRGSWRNQFYLNLWLLDYFAFCCWNVWYLLPRSKDFSKAGFTRWYFGVDWTRNPIRPIPCRFRLFSFGHSFQLEFRMSILMMWNFPPKNRYCEPSRRVNSRNGFWRGIAWGLRVEIPHQNLGGKSGWQEPFKGYDCWVHSMHIESRGGRSDICANKEKVVKPVSISDACVTTR